MVAYVLLIVITLTIATLVYNYLRHYIWKPQEECPDGISLYIEDYKCNNTLHQMNLTLRNNGLFTIYGIKVKVTNDKDKSPYIPLGEVLPGILGAPSEVRPKIINLSVGDAKEVSFWLNGTGKTGEIYRIEIIPLYKKNQTQDALVCSNSKIVQEISGCSLYS